MLTRFCLYGFLKNQRYFEPFLVLFFLEKGLSFFEIGLLIALREVVVNLVEVPSGAIADLYGRRGAMIGSFSAYIVSFILFAVAGSLPMLAVAMALFGVGEAFRTGTHKAIIFSWLRSQGREEERTRVYGITRSWSKFGSALSVVLAAVFVLVGRSYAIVFWAAVVPYVLGIANFLGYPAAANKGRGTERSVREVARQLWQVSRDTLRHAHQRRLVIESMAFEGVFRAAKDYLQPLLQAAALAWVPLAVAQFGGGVDLETLDAAQQTALLVGPVYFVLHLLSGLASRRAHRLTTRFAGEDRAATATWRMALVLYALLLPTLLWSWYAVAIAGFVALHVVQNLWRPIQIARFDVWTPEEHGATVLSIENQAKTVSTMVVAPALGLAVDAVMARGLGGELWPVAALGVLACLAFVRGSQGHSAGGTKSAEYTT
jgi:MFS family permease